MVGSRSGTQQEEEEANKRAQANTAEDQTENLKAHVTVKRIRSMQLSIRLRDTKDAAETSRRQRSYMLELGRWEMKHRGRVKLLENKRHYRQEKASS